MKKEQISDSVKQIISETIGQAVNIMNNSQLLSEAGINMDSLMYLNLLVKIEKYFNISLSDDLWDDHSLKTIDEFTDCILSTIDKGINYDNI